MKSRWVALTALATLLGGCGGSPAPEQQKPAAVTPAAPPATPSSPAQVPKEPEPPSPLPSKVYEARGRRDPFRPLVTAEGAKGPAAASMKLVGIVHGQQGPLALVETTDGLGYIVKVGDVIGDGRVTEIGGESVTLTVAGRPGQAPSRVVLRLKAD